MKLDKLELTSAPRDLAPDQVVRAIVKVNRPDYVPEGCEVRARVDATMFTAEFPAKRLDAIQADPAVVSVALAKPLRSAE